MRVKSPEVQPSFVHAEAPITLPNSRQRRRLQPWSSPYTRPAAKASPAPEGSTTSTARSGQLDLLVAAHRDEPAFAHRDDDCPGAEPEQTLGLPARVALSGERRRLVVVRHEVVDLGQDARDVVERERTARRGDDVEDDARAGQPRGSQLRGELVLPQAREHEKAADVDDVGRRCDCRPEVGGAKGCVRAEGVDVAPVLSGHRDDHRLRGTEARGTADAADVDPGGAELVLDELPEDVVSHLRDDRRSHAEPRERHGCVRGTAAGLDDEVFRRDELRPARAGRQEAARTRLRRRSRQQSTGALAIGDHGRAPDVGVGEDIVLVALAGGELGDDRALGPGLEPVQGPGMIVYWSPGLEHDLVPDGVDAGAAGGGPQAASASARPPT